MITLDSVQEIVHLEQSIETERLVLRPISSGDAPDIYRYASDPEVTRFMCWDTHVSIVVTHAFIRSHLKQSNEGKVLGFGLVLKSENRLVGMCSFHELNYAHSRGEIGYVLSRTFWRKGLMTEAVQALVNFGFETLRFNRIEARCNPENIGSQKVMGNVGMTYEGTIREQMFVKGKFQDFQLHSILLSEFNSNGHHQS